MKITDRKSVLEGARERNLTVEEINSEERAYLCNVRRQMQRQTRIYSDIYSEHSHVNKQKVIHTEETNMWTDS